MATEHTPGPWTIEQPWNGFSSVRGANGELIFGLAAGCSDEKQPDDICEANARLIAAAPDMLKALKLQLRYEAGISGSSERPGWQESVKARDAAISKATAAGGDQ